MKFKFIPVDIHNYFSIFGEILTTYFGALKLLSSLIGGGGNNEDKYNKYFSN